MSRRLDAGGAPERARRHLAPRLRYPATAMRGCLPLSLCAIALVACQGSVTGPETTEAPAPARSAAADAEASWPTPPPYDLEADVALRTALADMHFGGHAYASVVSNVFVFATDDYDGSSATLMKDALGALLHDRFSRLPSRAITIYALRDRWGFRQVCQELGWDDCKSLLGMWFKETREIVVDLSLGDSTLVHELVHPLLAADGEAVPGGPPAWDAPRWIREGIASLFEQPVITPGEIHGKTNWRLADLRRAQASTQDRELVHLDALFRMENDAFFPPHELPAYAVARYACQWMDAPEQDGLWRFYRAWRTHAVEDPTGEASFAAVFGRTPKEADAAWQAWLRTLR